MATWSWIELQELFRIHIFDCVWNTSHVTFSVLPIIYPASTVPQVLGGYENNAYFFFQKLRLQLIFMFS